MSSFMKKLAERDSKTREKMKERLQGESTLFMGDPSLHWGQGGWVRGRANLIYGPSGSGKSALALKAAAAEQQKTDGYVIVYDSEYSHAGPLNAEESRALARYRDAGLNTEKVIVIQSNEVDVLFQDLAALEKDVKSGDLNVSAIIVDSWGGIESEQAKAKIDAGELASAGNSFGGNAKTMGPILQHLLRLSAENGVTMFFVQHCMMNMDQYGPRYVLLGGQKLRFLVHATLFVESVQAKDASLLEGDQASESNDFAVRIGKKIRFRCEKSREVVEGRKGEFWFDFEKVRFARPAESLFNLATNLGVIGHTRTPILEDKGPLMGKPKLGADGKPMYKENKAWWEFPVGSPNPSKFNGAAQTIEALAANKQLFDEVFQSCMKSEKTDAAGGVKLGEEVGFTNGEDFGGAKTKGKKK
jgi:RecA/RadA recombinase